MAKTSARRKSKPQPRAKVHVAKGAILRRMDTLAQNRAVMEAAMKALLDNPKARLVDLGLQHTYVKKSGGEAEHISKHWFTAGSGVERSLRAAFIKAARLSIDNNLPVDCYSISGTVQFAAAVTKSAQQITLLLMSPPSPFKLAVREKDIAVFVAGRSLR